MIVDYPGLRPDDLTPAIAEDLAWFDAHRYHAPRLVFAVVGPSGAGKTSIVEAVLAEDPTLYCPTGWTTRPQRPGEPDDAYRFVSRADFEDAIAAGGFLEHAEFLGNLYGTPFPRPGLVPDGDDVVLEIEVQGAQQVLALDPTALLLFIAPPSSEEQERRLRGRGDPDEIIARRLAKAAEETDAARELGAVMVVNDDLERAVAEVLEIIRSRRLR